MEHRFSGKTVVRAAPQVRFASGNVARFAAHSFAATDQGVRNAPHVLIWDRALQGWDEGWGPREWRMTMDADVAKGGRARLSCSNRCDAEVASTPRGSRGNEAPFKEIRASSRRLPRVLHLFSRDGSVKGGSPLPRRNLHRQSSVLHSPRPWHGGCNTGLT